MPVQKIDAALLKRGLLLFWALWLSLVLVTNVLDGAKALGLLAESWTFASGNYAFLCRTTARHGTPEWVNRVLFAGVIAWEALAALLFWLAAWTYRGRLLYPAFAVGLSLWAAFILADEVFVAYEVAGTHWRLFVAQLVTLLAIELLPDREARV
jgi:hypothetical protein